MKFLSVTFVVVDDEIHDAQALGGVAFRVEGLSDDELERLRKRLVFTFRREAGQEIDGALARCEPRGDGPIDAKEQQRRLSLGDHGEVRSGGSASDDLARSMARRPPTA